MGPGGPLPIRNQVGDTGPPPPELKHDDNCALTRASAWGLESIVGSKPNSGDFADSLRNVTVLYVGGWQLWIAAKSLFDFYFVGFPNGGLVRQNGGPFRVRPWHYERYRGCLLSRFVCRSNGHLSSYFATISSLDSYMVASDL